ncbi:hypothetical protein [Burkholderia metallica]|uniref:hypothetical protein n=1 Tax=Burkholderia metallica TaxID=488729 RepID=UPI000D1B8679|nr:hypothetical protein [Burkholderia metallica]
MAIENDFLPFAVGEGANVLSQSAYAALSALSSGYQAGTAQSAACNKTWRQSSVMTAVIAQFIVAQTNQPAIDDGTTATLLVNFTAAVNAAAKNTTTLSDTGVANAYAASNAVPMTALPTSSGVLQTISVAHANTGASTYAPDGLPAAPIFGLGGLALQGGEMVTAGVATLVSYVGALLNGGSLCWVLVSCTGAAMQVAPATASEHAPQIGQLYGGLKGIARWTSSTTWVSPFTGTAYASGCAGGGGGGSVASTSANQIVGGAGGGSAGEFAERVPIQVVKGQSYAITIGAGGAPSAAGGATSIAGLLTLAGGLPGTNPTAGSAALYVAGGAPAADARTGSYGQDSGPQGPGGSSGSGASGPYGGGGSSVRGISAGGNMLNGFPGSGFGAGGSGAGGCYSFGNSTSSPSVGAVGGAGSPGFLVLEW